MIISQKHKVAFTIDYDKITKFLHTKCGIDVPYYLETQYDSLPYNFTALWDTGATSSVISSNVVNALNLTPTGRTKMYHAGGESIVNVYSISIFLPNNILVPIIKVTDAKLKNTDILIGMDIITAGDFVITSLQSKTKFSFQIPSTHNTDYNKELLTN